MFGFLQISNWWQSEQEGCSSTYRELRSIESRLILIGPEANGCVVKYSNDNYAAVRVDEYGSTKEECYEMARRINEKKVAVSYSRLYQSLESSKERLGAGCFYEVAFVSNMCRHKRR